MPLVVKGFKLYSLTERFMYSQKNAVFLICAIVVVVMISFALVEHQNVFAQVKPTFKEFPVKNGSLAT